MTFDSRTSREGAYVLVTVTGQPSVHDLITIIRDTGAASVGWSVSAVLVDLRQVATPYSFTEQLRIGQAVGTNLGHLAKVAAVVPADRITRVGEKAAIHTGAKVRVFATQADAVQWFLD